MRSPAPGPAGFGRLPAEDLLVVEFCDTSGPDGIYRKYSAFRVGSVILPRHLMFSRHWKIKKPDLATLPLAQEHDWFLKENLIKAG
jgi:hypothetical protein